MNNPNKKRLRRTMMFLNAQKPGLIKDPYIYAGGFFIHYTVLAGRRSSAPLLMVLS